MRPFRPIHTDMRKEARTGPRGTLRRPGPGVVLAHGLALSGAVALAAVTDGFSRWNLGQLTVIAGFAIVSLLTDFESESKLRVSGGHVASTLGMVLLGGNPAAAVGAATMLVAWMRNRPPVHVLINNLVTFTWFPLLGGLFFHATRTLFKAGPDSAAYYLLVFATFVVALTVNFLGIFGYRCYLERSSLLERARDAALPLMSAQLFTALLTMGAVWATVQTGTVGIALAALTLVIFQYLIGELLKSKKRGAELHRMATRAAFGKAGISCPGNTVGTSIIEAAPGLDQHVQAHEKPRQVRSPRVINQEFIDYQRSTFFERGMRLADQHTFRGKVPVVQDQSHHQHVGPR